MSEKGRNIGKCLNISDNYTKEQSLQIQIMYHVLQKHENRIFQQTCGHIYRRINQLINTASVR